MTDRTYRADFGVVAVDGAPRWCADVWVRVNPEGTIVAVGSGDLPTDATAHDLGAHALLPGLVNAHSHAFQRLIRGKTHRRGTADPSSFWSWRTAMYEAANALDPDALEEATTDCYREMVASGISHVGEFHYVHHQPGGTPYDDANEMSWRVIAAARASGLKLTLLEVYYARASATAEPLPEQRRFCDASVEAYLARVDALRSGTADDPNVTIGLAPHSIRAVSGEDLERLGEYARTHDLVMHAHVSEQPRENEECQAEHGATPTRVFADRGCLDRPHRFTAVHAIHVSDDDVDLLSSQHVCACPTTEADLGDGIVPAGTYVAAGTRVCLGSDSNAVVDLVQEARLLEMHERLRTGARLCLAQDGTLGPALLAHATTAGASSLNPRGPRTGLAPGLPFDALAIDARHPSVGPSPEYALDGLLTAGTAAAVTHVWTDGVRRR